MFTEKAGFWQSISEEETGTTEELKDKYLTAHAQRTPGVRRWLS